MTTPRVDLLSDAALDALMADNNIRADVRNTVAALRERVRELESEIGIDKSECSTYERALLGAVERADRAEARVAELERPPTSEEMEKAAKWLDLQSELVDDDSMFDVVLELLRRLDRDLARVTGERDAAVKDAERWGAVAMLWTACAELTFRQDDDGRWSISVVEAVEALPLPGHWVGDDPDACVDTIAAAEGRKG